MAGKKSAKGSDSGKQLSLNIGVNVSEAKKTTEDLNKTLEKSVKTADKVSDSFEHLLKLLKNGEKLTEDQVKLLQQYYKLAKDSESIETQRANTRKTIAQTEAAQSAKNLSNTKAQIALEDQAYKRQRDALKDIENQKKAANKAELDRIRKLKQEENDRIKQLKQNLTDYKQQQKRLQTTGYGAIVNSFTEGLPARLGTALSYKTIGVGLQTIKDSMSSISNLQQQFAAVYAITDTTAASMERLRGTIMDVGNASIYSTEQLAQATITLGQAGLSAEQIVDALEAVNNLAVGTGTDLAMSVNVLTSSLAVWNKEASQAGHVADVLTTAANRTRADVGTMANAIQYAGAAASDLGVSFEEFASVASAVTNAGLKARSVVGTGFRSVLTELINPSAKLQKVFEQLGIKLEDVDVRSRGLVNVLKTLKDAGLDAGMAFQGFDRRAASFFIAATSQLDTVNKLRDAFLQEGAAQRAAEKQLDTFNGQFERLKNTMKKAFSEAFRPFLAILTQMMEWLADFNSTKMGQWITQITAVSIAILAIKNAVTGLVKALQSLKAIKLLVIAATKEYIAAQKTESVVETTAAATSKATAGALTTVGTAAKGAATGVKIFGLTLKSILVTTGVGAAIVVLTHLISSIKSTEEVFDETNNKIKESQDRVKSLESAYDELVEKQKLYREDQNALIIRGKELNKQFELQGQLLLKAGDSLDQYLHKFQSLMSLEKRKQLFEIGKLIPEAEKNKKAATIGNPSSMEYQTWFANATGYGYWDLQSEVKKLAKQGDDAAFAKLAEIQANLYERLTQTILYDSNSPQFNRSETLDQINKFIENTVEFEDLLRRQRELRAEINQAPITAETLVKLDTDLQDVRDAFTKGLGKATNVDSYEKMATGLIELKEEIERERIARKEDLDKQIAEAKAQGLTSTVEQLTKRQNAFNLLYGENLNTVDAKIKEVLDKRVQTTGKALQDFSKAVEKGQTGMSVEEQTKQMKYLEEEFEQAVSLQEKYEKSLIDRAEQLRKEGLDKKIKKEYDKLAKVNEEFNAANDVASSMDISVKMNKILEDIDELERQKREGTAVYNAALTDMRNKYASLRLERFSRANAADSKNQSKVGSTFGDLLPYTAALYGGSESEQFKALEKTYNEGKSSKFDVSLYGLGRGAIRYGQGLAGDKNLTNFMDDTLGETALKGIDTFVDGFSNAVTEFANSSKKFKDALQDFARSSLQTIGNWIIQMSIKAAAMLALKAMFPEFFAASTATTGATSAAATTVGQAAGGYVSGGIPNRDSVNTNLMPGEYVLKKSAVDYLGKNFLNSLNTNTAQTMSAVSGGVVVGDESPASVVNVWVVSEEEEAGMGPNDVIATVTKDIRNGGQTRQLIKSIVAGRK